MILFGAFVDLAIAVRSQEHALIANAVPERE
jgi:hypothetical protein